MDPNNPYYHNPHSYHPTLYQQQQQDQYHFYPFNTNNTNANTNTNTINNYPYHHTPPNYYLSIPHHNPHSNFTTYIPQQQQQPTSHTSITFPNPPLQLPTPHNTTSLQSGNGKKNSQDEATPSSSTRSIVFSKPLEKGVLVQRQKATTKGKRRQVRLEIDAAVEGATKDLIAAGEWVLSWKVSLLALSILHTDSWDFLGSRLNKVPTFQRIVAAEAVVGFLLFLLSNASLLPKPWLPKVLWKSSSLCGWSLAKSTQH